MSAATIAAACEYFAVSPDQLRGRSRNIRLVMARAAIAYVMKTRDGVSYPQIGRRLGNRDHTTIMNVAKNRAVQWLADEPFFAAFVNAQMALPKHSPEAARPKAPKVLQMLVLNPKPPPVVPSEYTVEFVRGQRLMFDAEGRSPAENEMFDGLRRGSLKLVARLRREHPDRFAA